MTEDKPDATENTPDVTVESETTLQDDIEAAITARLEAERERLRVEVEEGLKQEYAERQATERKAAADQVELTELSGSFSTAVREAYQNWKGLKLYDETSMEAREAKDEDFQKFFVEPFQKYNQKSLEATSVQMAAKFAEAALSLIPPEDHETFRKKAGRKPPAEWLQVLSEMLAPKSEWAKVQSKEVEAKVKAAEARALAKAQKAGTPPPTSTEGKASPNIDYDNIISITQARNKNQLSHDEWYKHFKRLTNA